MGTRVQAPDHLQRGREAVARRAWATAVEELRLADGEAVTTGGALSGDDLELLGTAAYMRGCLDEHHDALQRAYAAHEATGAPLRAARCAFWSGMQLLISGEVGSAGGWLARARRLVDAEGADCVERGFLIMPRAFELGMRGRPADGAELAAQAVEAGRRFGEADLVALALHSQGHLLVRAGKVADGLALLDEAMVAIAAGEVAPIATGIVYCGVITGCRAAFEVRRAQEWTSTLSRWCAEQPEMVAFTGACLVHRAEIMQLRGAWSDALEEARRAAERCVEARSVAQARYLQAELDRLQGRLDAAEAGYREAARGGWEPQPGLALLRLAQGNPAVAAVALRRVLAETSDAARRAESLPAFVEVLLADGDLEGAREASSELGRLADGHPSAMLAACAEQARGTVALSGGDAREALPALRRAWRTWQEIGAPYEGARVRVLVAEACRDLGDEDAALMELDAAREVFAGLGAAPEIARVERLVRRDGGQRHGLTARELEVLRLVASGATNRAIAAELVLSEKTVDRHVSNILAKLRVPSRAAATAFAYEHGLL